MDPKQAPTLCVIDKYVPQLTESYNKLFATGYQIDHNDHKSFVNRVIGVRRKYNIPDRILLP
jgi:hypothetical protein